MPKTKPECLCPLDLEAGNGAKLVCQSRKGQNKRCALSDAVGEFSSDTLPMKAIFVINITMVNSELLILNSLSHTTGVDIQY